MGCGTSVVAEAVRCGSGTAMLLSPISCGGEGMTERHILEGIHQHEQQTERNEAGTLASEPGETMRRIDLKLRSWSCAYRLRRDNVVFDEESQRTVSSNFRRRERHVARWLADVAHATDTPDDPDNVEGGKDVGSDEGKAATLRAHHIHLATTPTSERDSVSYVSHAVSSDMQVSASHTRSGWTSGTPSVGLACTVDTSLNLTASSLGERGGGSSARGAGGATPSAAVLSTPGGDTLASVELRTWSPALRVCDVTDEQLSTQDGHIPAGSTSPHPPQHRGSSPSVSRRCVAAGSLRTAASAPATPGDDDTLRSSNATCAAPLSPTPPQAAAALDSGDESPYRTYGPLDQPGPALNVMRHTPRGRQHRKPSYLRTPSLGGHQHAPGKPCTTCAAVRHVMEDGGNDDDAGGDAGAGAGALSPAPPTPAPLRVTRHGSTAVSFLSACSASMYDRSLLGGHRQPSMCSALSDDFPGDPAGRFTPGPPCGAEHGAAPRPPARGSMPPRAPRRTVAGFV